MCRLQAQSMPAWEQFQAVKWCRAGQLFRADLFLGGALAGGLVQQVHSLADVPDPDLHANNTPFSCAPADLSILPPESAKPSGTSGTTTASRPTTHTLNARSFKSES